MACSVRSLEFARRPLSALSVMTGLEKAEIYDRLYEGLRHAIILVHSFSPRSSAAALLPLLDLLISLQVDSMSRWRQVCFISRAMDKEIGVILASTVQLALLLPVEPGAETQAAATLSGLLRELGEAGVVSIEDVQGSWQRLLDVGVQRWQLELLLTGPSGHKLLLPQWRADQPPVRKRQRASLSDALRAGEPFERNQALAQLDQEVLAKTTVGPYESRLVVWRRICAKWDVPAFPLDDRNVRAVAASLKRGRYRSSEQYFSAAASHQTRRLHMTVPAHIRSIIRDCVRSIRRGLGPSALKDSFDLRCLAPSVMEGSEFQAVSWSVLPAAVDALLVAAYFCMREIEMASASSSHPSFQDGRLSMLLPAHKSSSQGELTCRALCCGCAVRRQEMCHWHAGARHLQRLEILQAGLNQHTLPLFPDDQGKALSKADMIATIRSALRAAGVQTTRPDESGAQVERFSGHVLRVAGTQHLYLLGLRFDMVQLHGRWSSLAVQRYLQSASLLVVPSTVARALSSGRAREHSVDQQLGVRDPQLVAPREAASTAEPSEAQSCMPARGEAEVAALRLQFADFVDRTHAEDQALVVNTRTKRAHLPDANESQARPELWATACGILYGNTRFFRTSASRPEWARCKRCFPDPGIPGAEPGERQGDSSSEDGSSSSLPSSSSSASS
ncbi:unnamed protein product [Symbiodinium microadriaticum]|nr:unnamed protein product [Symbiodinium microadriaticum]CAE7721193.1 unnamed protein product [Symbiodinium sp. KB8]